MSTSYVINSVGQAHQVLGLPKPMHPLVTVIQVKDIHALPDLWNARIAMDLYQIMLKQGVRGTLKYGRNSYDYEEGTLIFTAPGQVLEYEEASEGPGDNAEGWSLVFHPDLIRKSELGNKIHLYTFFDYASNEALHLSGEERRTIEELLDKIVKEYSQNLDQHSQRLIISTIQLLLDYCRRFYDRQFYTRTNLNTDIVSKFERLLKSYYQTDKVAALGLPSVHYCAKELSLSPNYLSDLLKKETGKTAQEHIHLYIIEKAKTRLLNSAHSVSQIGYELGFGYPQHFSNLFKSKTGFSPRDYRNKN